MQGSLKEITNHLLKEYAKKIGLRDENAWKSVGVGGLNGQKVVQLSNNQKFSFWAGSSGCNWNLLDSTGGNHDCEAYQDSEIFELLN